METSKCILYYYYNYNYFSKHNPKTPYNPHATNIPSISHKKDHIIDMSLIFNYVINEIKYNYIGIFFQKKLYKHLILWYILYHIIISYGLKKLKTIKSLKLKLFITYFNILIEVNYIVVVLRTN